MTLKLCVLSLWTLALSAAAAVTLAQNGAAPSASAPAPATAAPATATPAMATPATAPSNVGRPVYSEPSTGLQMPPGCHMEPSWRTRLTQSDYEVWIVTCKEIARTWLVKRSVIEMVNATQARLRFQILDERVWPEESAGDSLSVQCVGRARQEAGYVVAGAKWRTPPAKGGDATLTLAQARQVVRADVASQKFVDAPVADAQCTRYPEREAMMRRLQEQSQR